MCHLSVVVCSGYATDTINKPYFWYQPKLTR